MAFLTFEPKLQSYITADKLLAPSSVNQAFHSSATKRLSDEEHEAQANLENPPHDTPNPYIPKESSLTLEKAVSAEQIMTTTVMTLGETTTLQQARRMFREHRFRHMPITDNDEQIIGIVSDRDILSHPTDNPNTPITQLIVSRVIVATPETEIRDIAAIFFQQRIGAMPIISDKEKLIGIITRSDILRALVHRAPFEMWI